ncbi:hypothetical protein LG329_15860 [Virgibacillus necropolis]|uniref:CBO0543 family protein n=1 Tax=Virgibacillus necropolis TaxID=163877 RepID=UPI00385181DC
MLIIGIALLVISLRKPPMKDWILIFLLTSYFSTFFGVIVVEENMLDYPIKLFPHEHFDSHILYEYLILPVVCVYFYQTTYHSGYKGIFLQCLIYTSALTIIEVIFEKYTDLLEYNTWTWIHTFIGVFLLMFFVRFLMKLLIRKT